MIAAEYDISIDEGTDYSQAFQFLDTLGNPIDITGATAAAQIRKTYSDHLPLLTFDINIGDLNGTVTISLADTLTANLPLAYPTATKDKPAKGVWDLFFTDTNGNVTGIAGSKVRVVKGKVNLFARVTR